nr:hypothetical protein FB451DRAFT_1312569 [Mycena latifolia]
MPSHSLVHSHSISLPHARIPRRARPTLRLAPLAPLAQRMSPGLLRARAPYRAKNPLLGGALLAFGRPRGRRSSPSSRTRSTPSTMPRGPGHRGREEGDADGGEACDCRRGGGATVRTIPSRFMLSCCQVYASIARPIYGSGKRLLVRGRRRVTHSKIRSSLSIIQ